MSTSVSVALSTLLVMKSFGGTPSFFAFSPLTSLVISVRVASTFSKQASMMTLMASGVLSLELAPEERLDLGSGMGCPQYGECPP